MKVFMTTLALGILAAGLAGCKVETSSAPAEPAAAPADAPAVAPETAK